MAAYVYFGLPDQEANVMGPFFSLNISRVVQSTGLGVNMELSLLNDNNNEIQFMKLFF